MWPTKPQRADSVLGARIVGNQAGVMVDEQRFLRQMLVSGVGEAGQRAIGRGRVLVVGCGALGSVIASFLVRAGVGVVRLVDPDRVEVCNLHRQILFDEQDASEGRAKAEAAVARLERVHPSVRIEALLTRLDGSNAEDLIRHVDVVADGTDNFETRYLINEACVRLGVPWVYGGVVGMTGMSMTVVPHCTPCLRCVFPEAPRPGVGSAPERDGVFGPVVGVVGSLEAGEVLKLLVGGEPSHGLARVDLSDGTLARLNLGGRRADCETCGG
jgi:molybdopterin/thiamine biosynthesis adenylyltransferase